MQITGTGNGENIFQSLTQYKVGQRLLVQVVSVGDRGYGKVLLNGEEFAAKLESSVQTGQKFWGLVKEISQNEVLVIKHYPSEMTDTERLGSTNAQILKGVTETDPELKLLMADFPESPETLIQMISNIAEEPEKGLVWQDYLQEVPQWSTLEGDSAGKIVQFLKKLGLNYEQRFIQACKLPDTLQENEFAGLKDTLKGRILSALEQHKPSEPMQTNLKKILHSLTGQQIFLQKEDGDNLFVLLNLPLHDAGKLYDVRIAAEGPRKGNKLNPEHYHLGIFTETLVLGELGVESWIHEGQIAIKIFSGLGDVLRPFSTAIFPQTRDGFAKLGLTLQGIELANWEQAGFFRKFLDGKSQSGVDILR